MKEGTFGPVGVTEAAQKTTESGKKGIYTGELSELARAQIILMNSVDTENGSETDGTEDDTTDGVAEEENPTQNPQ